MSLTKRQFLTLSSLSALALVTKANHLVTDSPSRFIIGTGKDSEGNYVLAAMDLDGTTLYKHPLPARGHGLNSNSLGQSLVVARRPGDFALIFETRTGRPIKAINPPDSMHLYGHGLFASDTLVFTAGDRKTSQGYLLIYSLEGKLLDRLTLPGLGPHEIIQNKANPKQWIVAMGGIHTLGREALNLDTMESSLIGINNKSMTVLWQDTLPHPQLSIRHLDSNSKGWIAAACQYQGEPIESPSLLAIKKPGQPLKLINDGPEQWFGFNGYLGSVNMNENKIVATSPKGNRIGTWPLHQTDQMKSEFFRDACAVALDGNHLLVGTGTGQWLNNRSKLSTDVIWDNHWILA